MKLLVLDECHVLPWVVRRLAPETVAVECTACLEEAIRKLSQTDAPDAVMVSLTPARIPWREFQAICDHHQPPIPVLYESCIHGSAAEAGAGSEHGYAAFIAKPAHKEELQVAIQELLAASRRLRRGEARAL